MERIIDLLIKAWRKGEGFNGISAEMTAIIAESIVEDQAALLRKAGDRAVAWCEEWAEVPWSQITKDSLRAAIEGKE